MVKCRSFAVHEQRRDEVFLVGWPTRNVEDLQGAGRCESTPLFAGHLEKILSGHEVRSLGPFVTKVLRYLASFLTCHYRHPLVCAGICSSQAGRLTSSRTIAGSQYKNPSQGVQEGCLYVSDGQRRWSLPRIQSKSCEEDVAQME